MAKKNKDTQPLRPGDKKFNLNFSDPGAPFQKTEIEGIYAAIRRSLKTMVKDGENEKLVEKIFEDSLAVFSDVSKKSGSHILKIHNKNAQDHVLNFPYFSGGNESRRLFPSMNAKFAKYAKVIYQPIAVFGVEGSKGLVDHILCPNEISEDIYASFISAFSQESFDAICNSLRLEKKSVTQLHHENFPIIYVPDGEGGDLQLTPISPMESYRGFYKEVFFEKGKTPLFDLTHQVVSSQMQNVSSAIFGSRRRFMTSFPAAMAPSEAGVWRYVKGGAIPTIPGTEMSNLLESFLKLADAHRKKEAGIEGAYFDANMKSSAMNLAKWILRDAQEWVNEVNAAAQELFDEIKSNTSDPVEDFNPEPVDIINLLLRGYRGNLERREDIRRALLGSTFTKALEEGGV